VQQQEQTQDSSATYLVNRYFHNKLVISSVCPHIYLHRLLTLSVVK